MAYDLGIGVLCFNPTDDSAHLERIMNCLRSMVLAIGHTDKKVKLYVILNRSVVGKPRVPGVGPKTKKKITDLLAKSSADYLLEERESPTSMNALHYHTLQKYLHETAHCRKVVVFADDYIVSRNWINAVFAEFSRYKSADFLTPATTFVPQQTLLVPLVLKPLWHLVRQKERVTGIQTGISIPEVESISESLQNERTLRHIKHNSFETTVFTDKVLACCGYVDPAYFSIFFQIEYFKNIFDRGFRGVISRRSFVFHYGKGGTASVHKKTRDEKYVGSPVEKFLMHDVDLYNKRNNANHTYWWKEEDAAFSFPAISHEERNQEIRRMMKENDYYDKKQTIKQMLSLFICSKQ